MCSTRFIFRACAMLRNRTKLPAEIIFYHPDSLKSKIFLRSFQIRIKKWIWTRGRQCARVPKVLAQALAPCACAISENLMWRQHCPEGHNFIHPDYNHMKWHKSQWNRGISLNGISLNETDIIDNGISLNETDITDNGISLNETEAPGLYTLFWILTYNE
jgi:hypothetical protein